MFCLVRSLIFELLRVSLTIVFSFIAILTFPLSPIKRYRIITLWSYCITFLAKYICGIKYSVHGLDNIPNDPCVILSKHQSAWETFAFQTICPPQVWVLKSSLLLVPFFGWGLAMMNPIAIDRSSGSKALKQMLVQGRNRIENGWYIIVFPEGTRTSHRKKVDYQIGGAWLSAKLQSDILPVAHNAGEYWPKNALLKKPGTINVVIGEPIKTVGKSPADLIKQVETWIETNMPKNSLRDL